MKLYHGWLSSASRRVRLCLAEKGLPYESMPIDMSRQEHHAPAYLAMNPNGVVPALLLNNGESLYESSTICEYLDDIAPEPPLRPADPYQRGHAQLRALDRREVAAQPADTQLEHRLAAGRQPVE